MACPGPEPGEVALGLDRPGGREAGLRECRWPAWWPIVCKPAGQEPVLQDDRRGSRAGEGRVRSPALRCGLQASHQARARSGLLLSPVRGRGSQPEGSPGGPEGPHVRGERYAEVLPGQVLRAITIIDAPSIEIIDGMSAIDEVLRVPVASSLLRLAWWRWPVFSLGTITEEVVTSAESRECRGQADGKDRSRLDAAAASWQLPTAQAGCRGCGSDGNSSDRSPRSPRTSGNAPTWTHATDNFRTIAPPIVSMAGTQASSGLAPS